MYQPAMGSGLTVSLPGETVRATVARVVNRNTVLVELNAPLLNPARSHSYRVGDIVYVRRVEDMLGGPNGEKWEAVDERRLPEPPPEAKPRRKAAPRKRVTPKRARVGKSKKARH
jgi:hypothetical protein